MSDDRTSAPPPSPSPDAGGTPATGDSVTTGGGRVTARRSLRTPGGVRRAIVLREVLGPPVALRRGPSDVPGLGL